MPKKAKELTPLEVKRLSHPGVGRNVTFAVGGVPGLLLQITPSNARSWLLRYAFNSKRRNLGLGGYPEVSFGKAWQRGREARELIWQGIDPIDHKKSEMAAIRTAQLYELTFQQAMEQFLVGKLEEFDNLKHRKQWRATLDKYAVPVLGDLAVATITVADVLRVLEPIWLVKNETAARLRGRIEAVIAWATVAGHRDGDNPARWKGNLDAVLPKPSKVHKTLHHPALSLADAPHWFADLKTRNGVATKALEFMALTAARSGEIRGATWEEINLDARLWTVPAERMKARSEHRVPLTESAAGLLSGLERRLDSQFVFPAVRGGMLSDAGLSACMKRIQAARQGGYVDQRSGRPAVPHGLRSTFRDWVAERTEYPRDMAEIALAHRVGTEVERAYRRGDMLEKRRAMMAEWGRFLSGKAAVEIVQMGDTR